MCCCMLGKLSPIGCYFAIFPQLDHLFRGRQVQGSINLMPVLLEDITCILVDVSTRVLGGTDVHTTLKFLQVRLRAFVSGPILLACPNLLQKACCIILHVITFLTGTFVVFNVSKQLSFRICRFYFRRYCVEKSQSVAHLMIPRRLVKTVAAIEQGCCCSN